MDLINIILFVLLIGFIICLTFIADGIHTYNKFVKSYYEQPEDKTGLYDFININDNIINVDHIINIKQLISTQDDNCKIIIELDDNKEPIIFDFYDDYTECNIVFEQINAALDSVPIVAE